VYAGQGEHQSTPRQIKHFGARFSARPLQQLELGLSRVSQWGGDDLDNGLGAFGDMLLLQHGSEDNADNMAALDLTFHTQIADWPVSFYTELADANNGSELSKPLQLFGARTFFGSDSDV